MSTDQQFESVMHAWFEVLLSRSTNDFVRFMKKYELNNAQFGALMRLYHGGRCAVSDIGTQFGMTPPAASQLVEKLVEKGWVERTEFEHDRRVRQLKLTQEGRALVQGSFEARYSWALKLGEKLPPDRRDAIAQALSELIAAARSLDEPARDPVVTQG